MTDFRSRRVLITGAASGIGRLLALRIAARGGRLILWDEDAAHLAAVAAEIAAAGGQASVHACNLVEREAIEPAAARTLQDHGAVDILINNAGIVDGKRLLEATDEEIVRTFAVNTLAPFRTVRAFLPGMLAQGGGTSSPSPRPRASPPCRAWPTTPPARPPPSPSTSRCGWS